MKTVCLKINVLEIQTFLLSLSNCEMVNISFALSWVRSFQVYWSNFVIQLLDKAEIINTKKELNLEVN